MKLMRVKRILNVIELAVLFVSLCLLFIDRVFVCSRGHSRSYMGLSMEKYILFGPAVIALHVSVATLLLISIIKNADSKDSLWHVSLPLLTIFVFFLGGAFMTPFHQCGSYTAGPIFWLIVLLLLVVSIISFIKRSCSKASVEKKEPQIINNIQKTSNADELKKYKELLDSGVITQEEFDAKKKQLLGL